MRLYKAAEKLGAQHSVLPLQSDGGKRWRNRESDAWTNIEAATAKYFEQNGWSVCASEGGLILTLIKAASFPKIGERNCDTFIEALYSQNVAFPNDRFEIEWMLDNVSAATREQIMSNFGAIATGVGYTPAFYPSVYRHHVEGLFNALGAQRLHAISSLFATAPYDLRAGWPDLTIWQGQTVNFCEVKGPGDQIRASQERLISNILVPLGLPVSLIEVVPR